MLDVRNVDLFYGASQVLRSVSLKAQPGKVTAVMGRNGVGKTSLIRAICGRLPVASGQILWNGTDVARWPAYRRARNGFATVPQGREIFPQLTVRENLQTGLACLPRSERRIPESVLDLFPVLREMMDRRGGDLSGGQQQQLAIARALVTRPRLLVLDEPTEGIQPSIIKDIGSAIAWLRDRGDMAIILVEQYFDFARDLADSFVVMDRGEVIQAGLREEMVESDVRELLAV
ncbi:amino acid/amide ABC transporter ATP-binding protein 2 (HAAT family) [Albidovulum inexpectatum]|uniref:Amino acid/amide ABC transporter ATP-binding protein 2 (HAAT family) n=1 Tax=Albidovulum inexpectatum TaxID=196587 RepID=A0A2S5JHG4_9RHOB|nr:urea ABC transporter ATP-binding subunit UrtE [Albidovulum inexpectatum]PPB80808.1 amino acid/amide ABC transporter ATP-binding protein 2 (HAAT family) [Albidovulum inexpectatum]